MIVFTTGQVAKICKVAPRTVQKWFDTGRLKGYRIPGGQDRRIPREYLAEFQRENGMVLGSFEDPSAIKILVVTQNQKLFRVFNRKLTINTGICFKVQIVDTGFKAGIQFERFYPDFVVVDFAIGEAEALNICRDLGLMRGSFGVMVFAILPESSSVSFERSNIRETFRCPFEPELLIDRICQLSGIEK